MTYDFVRLGDICEIVSGTTPKTSIPSYWNGDQKWITPAELDENSFFITDSVRHISLDAVKNTGLRLLPKGTVILSSRAPIGKTAIAGCPLYCNQGFKNLICSPRINNVYLYLFLSSKTDYLNSLGRGATFKEISKSIVSDITIPLPSLSKQEKIAQKLLKIRSIMACRKKQHNLLEHLASSRFIELFGDCPNPQTFPVVKLANIAEKISDGVHAKPEYTPTGKPFLSVVNIVKGFVDFSDCKYVSEDAYRKMIRSTHPQRGDVLYTKVGATYGVPAYVDTERDFCLYVSVCLIKPDHSKVNSRFLAFSMKMPYVKRQADAKIKGIGVPDLHLNQIRDFDIILPSYDKQNDFVAFIEELDKSKLIVQKVGKCLKKLFAAVNYRKDL